MGDANNAFMRDQSVQARTKAQNRASVLQLKLIGQSHPTGLTPNLLKLFEPRPPLEYKPPPERRKCLPLSGMAQFVGRFAEPGDSEYAPPVPVVETPAQKKERIHKIRLEKGAQTAAEGLEKYDPSKDPNATGDPYKTLFVARLNYETSENKLKREFETYGPIKKVRMIVDKEMKKPRGYAFIEYVHTRDMKNAYKQADGKKVDGKRVLVDVERGRTVANWRPRRLGGGLGSTRVGGEEVNQKYSGRDAHQHASSGPPRSEEPRIVEREREKSRDRRERERERSRERSNDRGRDRNVRDDRHHRRDRDRNRDRDRDREKDRGRDRDRGRERHHDRERDRDHDRDRNRDRDRGRNREREREYGRGGHDEDRNRGRDGEKEYDHEPIHGQTWYPDNDEHEHGQIIEGYDYPPYEIPEPQPMGEHGFERDLRQREDEYPNHAQFNKNESDGPSDLRQREDEYPNHAQFNKNESDGPSGQYGRMSLDMHGRERASSREYDYHAEKPLPEE